MNQLSKGPSLIPKQRTRFLALLYSSAVFIVVLGVVLAVVFLLERYENEEFHRSTQDIASVTADTVTRHMERSLNEIRAVVRAIQARDDAKWSIAAAEIIEDHSEILGVQIAPGGVVSQSIGYTVSESNLMQPVNNYLKDYDYCAVAIQSIVNHQMEIVGPLPTDDNQFLVVGFQPVYFYDERFDRPCFWGFINIFVDLSDMLRRTSLNSLATIGYNFQITNKADPGSYTYTVGSAVSKDWKSDPHIATIPMEILGNRWEMSALRVSRETHYVHVASHLLLALLATLVITLVASRLFNYMARLQVTNQRLAVAIKERRAAQEKLLDQERLRVELEKERELAEIKNRFMSTLSHELRTPLAIIGMAGQMLERYEGRLTAEKRQGQLDRIKLQVDYLTRILDEFSMVLRAERGYIEFKPEPLNLADFCKTLVEETQLTLGIHHTILFKATDDLDDVMVDRQLFHHLLSNLLSNAVKYSDQGTTIQCNLYSEADMVVLCIRDEGIGIPLEDQKRLFEPYHRASNVGVVRGTGLGLKIAMDCVELHKGHITVESTPGEGSVFCIYLPRHHDLPQHSEVVAEPAG